jgi:hypothetical protein
MRSETEVLEGGTLGRSRPRDMESVQTTTLILSELPSMDIGGGGGGGGGEGGGGG